MPKMPASPDKGKTKVIEKAVASPEGEVKPVRKFETPQLLRGFKDILPADAPYWKALYKTVSHFASRYSFEAIETPILESAKLFEHTLGRDTDVVEKQMYIFQDLDGDRLALRPENTAGAARAYIVHGMRNLPQPVKLWYWGPYFRHERPQAGRFREFHQYGFEIFGDAEPAADAVIILIAARTLEELGIPVAVHINSIGCAVCRPAYRETLIEHYRAKRYLLCENCKRRLQRNPLRLLDCKEPSCQPVKETAPQSLDHLCEPCKSHMMRTLEYLDEIGIAYELDHTLVRGLDYYNRTVFEVYAQETKAFEEGEIAKDASEGGKIALGGGGRYDGLVELLGGPPTPACGFAHGIERIVARLREAGKAPSGEDAPQVFVAQLGEAARRRSIALFEDLRKSGMRVAESFSKTSLRAQLEIANRLKVPLTVILGQKEMLEGTAILREMDSGMQEVVPADKLKEILVERLRRVKIPEAAVVLPPAEAHSEEEIPSDELAVAAEEAPLADALEALPLEGADEPPPLTEKDEVIE